MKWEIWSFRVCNDCTAVERQRRKYKMILLTRVRVCVPAHMHTHAYILVFPATQCEIAWAHHQIQGSFYFQLSVTVSFNFQLDITWNHIGRESQQRVYWIGLWGAVLS